jgi:hypothetical protein
MSKVPTLDAKSRPHYLRAAVAEIDAHSDELAMLTKAHLRYENDAGSNEPLAA